MGMDEDIAELDSRLKNTYWHVTPYYIWEKYISSEGLIPRKNKRGVYGITKDAIYLFDDRDTAEDAMMNWLVDEFPTVRYFALIKVEMPLSEEDVWDDPELAGAVYSLSPIAVKYLSLVEKVDAGESE